MTDREPDRFDYPIARVESAPTESELLQQATRMEAALPQLQGSGRSFPEWSWGDVFAVLGFTVVAIMLFSMIALGVARIVTRQHPVPVGDLATNPIVVIAAQLAAYPVVIVFMMALVRIKSREGFWKAIRWNWLGASTLGFFLAGTLLALLLEFASRWLPIPKSLPVDKFFTDTTGAYLMAGFGIALAPLLEELFFRGMLYPLLRRSWGRVMAIAGTAVAFACIHGVQLGWAWAPVLAIFVVGVALTLLRERTNSVAASFLMHCGYNTALFTLLWFGSDHFRHLDKFTN